MSIVHKLAVCREPPESPVLAWVSSILLTSYVTSDMSTTQALLPLVVSVLDRGNQPHGVWFKQNPGGTLSPRAPNPGRFEVKVPGTHSRS